MLIFTEIVYSLRYNEPVTENRCVSGHNNDFELILVYSNFHFSNHISLKLSTSMKLTQITVHIKTFSTANFIK